jgi:biotin carboxylase
MSNVKGKRLVILGGIKMACSVVETAKNMGIYTIVVDYNEDSPAKKIADESFLVSTTDIDAVIKICKEKNVDGVFTSYIESMLPYCCDICRALDLPFYATGEQILITSDKYLFKELCRKNDVPTIKEFHLDDRFAPEDLSKIVFPVFTKPADNSGARGMAVCQNMSDLEAGYKKALDFSKRNKVIVEKYMDANCHCVNIDYLICDGRFYLAGVGDKYVCRSQYGFAPITSSVVYPSKHIDEYISVLNEKVVKMFQSIGINNGAIFIEAFYDDEGFHFYEMGYRIGGGQYYIMNFQITGLNFMEMMLTHALTGKMVHGADDLDGIINPKFPQVCCGLVIILGAGKITAIKGLEEVSDLKDVVNITQILELNDVLQQSDIGTLRQAFARIHIVSENEEYLNETITRIYALLTVEDEHGNNMIQPSLEIKDRASSKAESARRDPIQAQTGFPLAQA